MAKLKNKIFLRQHKGLQNFLSIQLDKRCPDFPKYFELADNGTDRMLVAAATLVYEWQQHEGKNWTGWNSDQGSFDLSDEFLRDIEVLKAGLPDHFDLAWLEDLMIDPVGEVDREGYDHFDGMFEHLLVTIVREIADITEGGK